MLAFRFTSHHDPHLSTRWCVIFVFLRNGWFVASVKVFYMAGCAIDQHCLRTDYPINLSFAKSGGASAVWWFDPDRFPNLVCITSDFWWRWFGVYALHTLLILVYTICCCTRWCFAIFGCRIATVIGYVHTKLISVVSHFYFSLFPPVIFTPIFTTLTFLYTRESVCLSIAEQTIDPHGEFPTWGPMCVLNEPRNHRHDLLVPNTGEMHWTEYASLHDIYWLYENLQCCEQGSAMEHPMKTRVPWPLCQAHVCFAYKNISIQSLLQVNNKNVYYSLTLVPGHDLWN